MSSTTVVARTATCRAWCLAWSRWAFDQWSVVMRGGAGFGGAAGGVDGVAGSFAVALAAVGARAGACRGFGDVTAGSFGARGGVGLRLSRPFGGVAAVGGVGGETLAAFRFFAGFFFVAFLAARNFLKSRDVASSGEAAAAAGDLTRRGGVTVVEAAGGGVGETVATARATDATAFSEGLRGGATSPFSKAMARKSFRYASRSAAKLGSVMNDVCANRRTRSISDSISRPA